MFLYIAGELGYLIPVLVAVLVAREVGNIFNSNIFDTIIRLRELPYLNFPKNPSNYMKVASEVSGIGCDEMKELYEL